MSFNSNFLSISSKKIHKDTDLRWDHIETNSEYRSEFSKDRDRILYSKSFLRLRGKTQIFMIQKNDYIRTRMTHSLEVNQIAKTIASALGQNNDLVEAIALGHDIGHAPFGHVGERILYELISEDENINAEERGFKHNLQALRLLCDLEKGADYPEHKGLNLTKYTLWGISHHSNIDQSKHPAYNDYLNKIDSYWSFEGFIVALADEIAQRHHDIEDGLRCGIIDREKLIDKIDEFSPIFKQNEKKCIKKLKAEIETLSDSVFNSLFARLVINMYVSDVIKFSKNNFKELVNQYSIKKQDDFFSAKPNIPSDVYEKQISFSPELKNYDEEFHNYLKSNILNSFQAQAFDGKAKYIIQKLFKAFKDNPTLLPDSSLCSFAEFININYKRSEISDQNFNDNKATLHRCIVDYIGGMTDQFAYNEFDRLYGTKIY